MILTIDTTHPLNETDRAVLRALLEGPAAIAAGHQQPDTARRHTSTESIMAAVAGSARKPDAGIASARLPVANQPGVSFTESTAEDDQTPG